METRWISSLDEQDIKDSIEHNSSHPLLQHLPGRLCIIHSIAQALAKLHEKKQAHRALDGAHVVLTQAMEIKIYMEKATNVTLLRRKAYREDILALAQIINNLFDDHHVHLPVWLMDLLLQIQRPTSPMTAIQIAEVVKDKMLQHTIEYGDNLKILLVILKFSEKTLNSKVPARPVPFRLQAVPATLDDSIDRLTIDKVDFNVMCSFIGKTRHALIEHAKAPRVKRQKKVQRLIVYEFSNRPYFVRYCNLRKRLHSNYINPIQGIIDERGKMILVAKTNVCTSLAQLLNDCAIHKKYVAWNEKLLIAREISRGLEYLHTNGVLHMNLHESNVFLREDNSVVLTMFGLDRADETTMTTIRNRCDTAPELTPCFASDIFALGLILMKFADYSPTYHIKLPELQHDNSSGLSQMALPPTSCPPWYRELVDLCTLTEASKRPNTATIIQKLNYHITHTLDPLPHVVGIAELDHSPLTQLQITSTGDVVNIQNAKYGTNIDIIRVKRVNTYTEHKIDARALLLNEFGLLSRVQSQYFVRQYGIVESKSPSPGVIIEKMHAGNLDELIRRIEDISTFKSDTKVHTAMSIAQALTDLHAVNYVHCDVHATNVYINNYGQVKLDNFYFAQPANLKLPNSIKGMIKCLAPEVLDGACFSKAADVYAFGMLLLGLSCCDRKPSRDEIEHITWCQELVRKCCHYDPEMRPTMQSVVKQLKAETSNNGPRFFEIKMKAFVDISAQLNQLRLILSEELMYGKQLGKGANGVIQEGIYDGEKVAIKIFLNSSESTMSAFVQEARLLNHCQHPQYVVKLIGICLKERWIVMELMECGLDQYLLRHAPAPEHFSWHDRALITLQIFKAICHLHKLGVVHLDVKSLNFLCSHDLECIKVADLGESRRIQDDWDVAPYLEATKTLGDVGTDAWKAPEIINCRVNVKQTEKADIYSCGAIMSEISTLDLPNGKTPVGNFKRGVSTGTLAPQFSTSTPSWFLDIATKCLRYEAQHRPTAEEVVCLLERAIHDNFPSPRVKIVE